MREKVLLLGAGFSRDWGGLLADEVFEHLLAIPAVQTDAYLRQLLWKRSSRGGFEEALTDVLSDHSRQPENIQPSLDALLGGVSAIFEAMNTAFLRLSSIEPGQDGSLTKFLTEFPAIFSLNQDVLLEHLYLPRIALAASESWSGPQLPGMKKATTDESWARATWIPAVEGKPVIRPRSQPLMKLHGSSNWKDSEGGRILIVGGNKSRAISAQTVLTWYHEEFKRRLHVGNTDLLVVGYSFRDQHINEVIISGVRDHGLRFFVIDPAGTDVMRRANSSYGGAIYSAGELDNAFNVGLVGASRRTMREAFGGDTVARDNLLAFMDRG